MRLPIRLVFPELVLRLETLQATIEQLREKYTQNTVTKR
jgi:hypothetical protein